VVVVVSSVVSGVTHRFPRQFQRVLAKSGPGADRIWLDLSGAAGCFVVVGVVVVGGGGVVGGVVGCCQPVSASIPASSGQFRAQSRQDLVGSVGGSGLVQLLLSFSSWGVPTRLPRQFR
jgi:hypothetical protein